MTLALMEYVSWLHKGENMKLQAAKEKAQEVFSRQTGQLIPLEYVMTPEEYKQMENDRKIRSLH